jgi:hypothetical protein
MEAWRKVWREGFEPQLSTSGLEALLRALSSDDQRLIQGATTIPPPLQCVQDWPTEAADAITFCAWQGDNLTTVGECEEFFAKSCFEADQRLGELGGCRHYLNWYDDVPRDEMRREMWAEVFRALSIRRQRETKQPTNYQSRPAW